MNIDTQELDYLFGEKSSGTTTRQRARTSKRMFVRSQDHLALDNPNATGRRLTPIEVLDIHGIVTSVQKYAPF